MKYFNAAFVAALLTAILATTVVAQEVEVPDQEEHQDQEVSASDIEQAQEYFDLGAQFFYEGEYSRAAVEFRRAHDSHPHPLFVFNMALSLQRMGRHEDALSAARQAQSMDEALPPKQAARNEGIIEGVETSSRGRELAGAIAEELGIEAPPQAEEAGESGLGAVGWAGIGALGLGAASMVGGGLVQRQISANREVYEPRLERHPESQQVSELGGIIAGQETQRTALFVGGGTLAAAGTAMIVMGVRSGGTTSDEGSDVELSFTVVDPGLWATFRW